MTTDETYDGGAQEEARGLRIKIEALRRENDALSGVLGERAETLAGAQEEARTLRSENEALRRENDEIKDVFGEYVETLAEGIYTQSRWFAERSEKEKKKRGMFIVLVDRVKMDERNFSAHNTEEQEEHLESEEWIYREEPEPRILSPDSFEVMEWMADEDGAVLVDLRGVMFRTRQHIEGVRTHNSMSDIEQLRVGGARHNAAIYASFLPEAAAAVVVSEENNAVTLFKNGKFVERYDPSAGKFFDRKKYFDTKTEL